MVLHVRQPNAQIRGRLHEQSGSGRRQPDQRKRAGLPERRDIPLLSRTRRTNAGKCTPITNLELSILKSLCLAQANSQAAERAYQQAFNVSAQKELRLLCMHEIAWCKLIQLDFNGAQQRFNELRQVSVFSKAFYTYMTAICQAAAGRCDQLAAYRDEIATQLAQNAKQRDSHIGLFVLHRLPLFPESSAGAAAAVGSGKTNQFYWRYLVYEVLFLWSALGSASRDELTAIVSDCSAPTVVEPIVGVQQLILGGALATLKQYQAAVNAYRLSVRQREADGAAEFQHIAAFARYELGMLLLQCSTDVSRRLARPNRLW